MALDIEEQQLVEQVKKWLAEYGLTLFVSILIAVVFLFGYQRWSQMRERAMAHASVRYEQLLNDLAANQVDASNQAAAYLIMRYPHSTYAKLAQLLLAQRDITQAKYQEAETKLNDVASKSGLTAIRDIARLRLARVQIQLNDPKDALTALGKIQTAEYLPTASAVKGDAYVAMNNTNGARQAYQQALSGFPDGAILKSMVAMKLNNLPA